MEKKIEKKKVREVRRRLKKFGMTNEDMKELIPKIFETAKSISVVVDKFSIKEFLKHASKNQNREHA